MEKWHRSLERLTYPFFPTVLVRIFLGLVVSGISYRKCLEGVCRSMDRPWELMAFFYCWLFIIVGWCTFLILFLYSNIREALCFAFERLMQDTAVLQTTSKFSSSERWHVSEFVHFFLHYGEYLWAVRSITDSMIRFNHSPPKSMTDSLALLMLNTHCA